MKIPLIFYIVGAVLLFSIRDGEVSAQNFMPGYYGSPVVYTGNGRNDDDFGMLLAILLLATRRGGGGNCCCNNARTVPVPYPIPFPTNNPIITTRNCNDDDSSKEPTVKVVTNSIDESSSGATSKSNPKVASNSGSSSSSSSGSASASGSGNGKKPRRRR